MCIRIWIAVGFCPHVPCWLFLSGLEGRSDSWLEKLIVGWFFYIKVRASSPLASLNPLALGVESSTGELLDHEQSLPVHVHCPIGGVSRFGSEILNCSSLFVPEIPIDSFLWSADLEVWWIAIAGFVNLDCGCGCRD